MRSEIQSGKRAFFCILILTLLCFTCFPQSGESNLTQNASGLPSTNKSANIQEFEQKRPVKWQGSISLGLTVTKGFRDTFIGTVNVNARRRSEDTKLDLSATAGYGETKQNGGVLTISKYARGNSSYDIDLSARTYLGFEASIEHDAIRGINYRAILASTLGYYLIKTNNCSLSLQIGASTAVEKYYELDPRWTYGIYAKESFEYIFVSQSRIWQQFTWIPDLKTWPDRHSMRFELGIETPVTPKLLTRVYLEDIYESIPPPNRDPNELRLITTVTYKF